MRVCLLRENKEELCDRINELFIEFVKQGKFENRNVYEKHHFTKSRSERIEKSQEITIRNFYPMAGNDANSCRDREKMFSETIPNLLLNKRNQSVTKTALNTLGAKNL